MLAIIIIKKEKNMYSINIHIIKKKDEQINTVLSFYLFAAPVITWMSSTFP